jgi:hypothetical protein
LIPNKSDRPLVTLDYNPLLGYFKVEDGAPDVTPKNKADADALRKLFAMQCLGVIRLIIPQSAILESQRPGDDMYTIAARLRGLGLDDNDIYEGARPVGFDVAESPGVVVFDTTLEQNMHRYIHTLLFEGKTEVGARNVDYSWPKYRDQECERQGIVDATHEALVELDRLRLYGNIEPSPLNPLGLQTPALDTLSPQQRRDVERIYQKMQRHWHNKKSDAEGLYIHASQVLASSLPQHAIFVTSDKHFMRHIPVDQAGKRVMKTVWELLKRRNFPGQLMTPEEAVDYLAKVTGVDLAGIS